MNLPVILASANPIEHVVDHPHVGGDGPWYTVSTLFSNHIAMQILAAVLLMLLIPRFVRVRSTGDAVRDLTPRGLGNFFESICNYLRNEVARPALGEHTDRFIGYIWTAFFFVLFCNLLGLLPLPALTKVIFGVEIGGTATGNIFVTATLAICTLLMIVVNGLRYNGMEFVKHLFQGPVFISPMIAALEVIGLLAKTFALAVRLFANMIAGHILLAVLLSFIGMAGAKGTGLGIAIAIPVVLGSVAINLLEIFVAFLQAFIFTFLTTIFIGQAVVIHHGEHGQGHAEAAHH
ncbi:MAG: F0F1 ATP synthase subunit A [Planctomycetota bacterium]|jgi:F-type H+-transporting ATPase subunit a